MKKFYFLLISLLWLGTTSSFGQNALSFDGVNDNVSIGQQLDLSTFTIEAWIKPSSVTNDGAIVSLLNGGRTAYNFEINVNSNALKLTGNNGSTWQDVYSNTELETNKWYHVAVTCNGAMEYKIYINGVLDVTKTLTGAHRHESAPLFIGRRLNSGGQYFSGLIDEVRIWNTVRTQSEIAANMGNQIANPATVTSLKAYYTFDQGAANGTNTGVTTLTDFSAVPNNGTLNGFTLTGTFSNWVTGISKYVLPITASKTLSAAAGSATINLAANTPWTVASNSTSWLTVSPGSGTTNGTVTPTYTSNATSMTSRTATVTFTGTDAQTQTIVFTQNAGIVITPDFTFVQTTFINANNVVDFTNATSASGTTITNTTWDFGDGTATSALPNPSHTYATNGVYKVKLTVSDGTNSKYIEKNVNIHNDIIMRNATITITDDKNFYDSGHSVANYANYESYVLVLKPTTAGQVIQIDFSTIKTETDCDYIYVYDGENTTSPQLKKYSGTLATQVVKATNATGALCVKFTSDYSYNNNGWSAIVKQVSGTSTAVDPIEQANECTVFPTHFSDLITVSTSQAIAGTYTITGINGRVVAKGKLDGDKTDLQVSDLNGGIYLLNVKTDNIDKTFKIVKK
jgi:PKD repeat protein